MGLESLVEVAHANDGVYQGKDDQQDGNDGEGCEGLADGLIRVFVVGLVDANQFEDKIGQAAQEKKHDTNCASLVLSAGEVGCGKENYNRNRDGCDGESKLGVRLLRDDDDKLDDET